MEPEVYEAAAQGFSQAIRTLIEEKQYGAAFQKLDHLKMLCMCAKLKLFDVMLATSPNLAKRIARETRLEQAAKAAIESAEKTAGYTESSAASARFLGNDVIQRLSSFVCRPLSSMNTPQVRLAARVAGRFAGPVGVVLLTTDVYAATTNLAEASARRAVCHKIACYGDYVESVEPEMPGKTPMLYREWLAAEYYPGKIQHDGEFWRHFRVLFPMGAPF